MKLLAFTQPDVEVSRQTSGFLAQLFGYIDKYWLWVVGAIALYIIIGLFRKNRNY